MPASRRLDNAARDRARRSTVTIDGRPVQCFEGETIAAVLLAEQTEAFYRGVDGSPRMPLCNMGTCYECTVTVDGAGLQRACTTPTRDGMDISTGAKR